MRQKMQALVRIMLAFGSEPARTAANKFRELFDSIMLSKMDSKLKKIGGTRVSSRNAEVQRLIDDFFSAGKSDFFGAEESGIEAEKR